MKTQLTMIVLALAIMGSAIAYAPQCTVDSPKGPRIGAVLLIAGCR